MIDARRWRELAGEGDEVSEWLKASHQAEVQLDGNGTFVTNEHRAADVPAVKGQSG
jgi:hypothetical protein